MNAEIITVGTELITGSTLDTHSAFISKKCYQLGIQVLLHSSVGDFRHNMLDLFRQSAERSDIVFICGGLGPTLDDMSKEVLAEGIDEPLYQDPHLVSILEQHFANRKMSPNNYRQTYAFANGEVFPNSNGTAPGLAVMKNQTTYILLPGPPRELIPMFENQVEAFLQKHVLVDKVMISSDLTFFGIGESLLEERIQHLLDVGLQTATDSLVATYIMDAEVIVRITCSAENIEQAQHTLKQITKLILQEVGEYCISQSAKKLEEVVVQSLHTFNKKVAVAESCTGGLLSYLFTTIPGSSDVLKGGVTLYSNEAKKQFLQLSTGLPQEGAVSYETARKLAEKALSHFDVDFALSVTGIAGPQSIEGKPVGLVYIALASKEIVTQVYRLTLSGSRQRIQTLAAKEALFILQQRMKER